jgi:hypothetical protein
MKFHPTSKADFEIYNNLAKIFDEMLAEKKRNVRVEELAKIASLSKRTIENSIHDIAEFWFSNLPDLKNYHLFYVSGISKDEANVLAQKIAECCGFPVEVRKVSNAQHEYAFELCCSFN